MAILTTVQAIIPTIGSVPAQTASQQQGHGQDRQRLLARILAHLTKPYLSDSSKYVKIGEISSEPGG